MAIQRLVIFFGIRAMARVCNGSVSFASKKKIATFFVIWIALRSIFFVPVYDDVAIRIHLAGNTFFGLYPISLEMVICSHCCDCVGWCDGFEYDRDAQKRYGAVV